MSDQVRAKNNLVGRRFGQLAVIGFSHRVRRPTSTSLYWTCQCDCGRTVIKDSNKLLHRGVSTCGQCSKPGGPRQEWPGYSSLKAAVARCHNPNNTFYRYYGARGIAVCARWRSGENGKTGFECFYEDMGPRPIGFTLDRIDCNGPYEPSNCRWATRRVQQRNQRRSIYAVVGGTRVPLKKYVQRLGLNYETIRFKVRRKGMTVSAAARDYLQRRAA